MARGYFVHPEAIALHMEKYLHSSQWVHAPEIREDFQGVT